MGQFRAPQLRFQANYDTEFVKDLAALCEREDFPAGTLGERKAELDHGSMIPLYYVNRYWQDYQLVRLGLSGLSLAEHYRLGQMIQHVAATSFCQIIDGV